GAARRPRRPHFRRPHLRADRPDHCRNDHDRVPLSRHRPFDRAADREPHRDALGNAAAMSMHRATPLPNQQAQREQTEFAVQAGAIVWRLLPALPFVFVLMLWMAGGAIFHLNKATLPPVSDVIEAVWSRL